MGILYNPVHFAALRQKSPDGAISPAWNNAFTVRHEFDTITSSLVKRFVLNNFDFEKLFALMRPDADFILAAGSEDLAKVRREANLIYCVIVTLHEHWSVVHLGCFRQTANDAFGRDAVDFASARCEAVDGLAVVIYFSLNK